MPDTLADFRIRVRRYGIPDPRVAKALDHENDPGLSRFGRAGVVGEIARQAGWPPAPNLLQVAQRQTRRLEELEGSSWHHRAQSKRTYRRRYGPDPGPADTLIRDDGPATIFDE